MKFKVTMKDPDTLHDSIEDAVKEDVLKMSGLSEDERQAVIEVRGNAAREVATTWFEYGEYLTVEIDTDAKTCVVVPRD